MLDFSWLLNAEWLLLFLQFSCSGKWMAFWLVDFVRIDYCSEIIAVVVKRKKKRIAWSIWGELIVWTFYRCEQTVQIISLIMFLKDDIISKCIKFSTQKITDISGWIKPCRVLDNIMIGKWSLKVGLTCLLVWFLLFYTKTVLWVPETRWAYRNKWDNINNNNIFHLYKAHF